MNAKRDSTEDATDEAPELLRLMLQFRQERNSESADAIMDILYTPYATLELLEKAIHQLGEIPINEAEAARAVAECAKTIGFAFHALQHENELRSEAAGFVTLAGIARMLDLPPDEEGGKPESK